LSQKIVVANELAIWTFNKWLYDNGHQKYVIKDNNSYKNNLNLKLSKRKWTLPEEANPNFDTLLYYFFRYQHSHFVPGSNTFQWDTYEIKPSTKHYKFKSDLKEDKYIAKQMNKTALLSYLLYEDGKITVDEISPKDRFGNFVKNETND